MVPAKFVASTEKHVGGNSNPMINFACNWSNLVSSLNSTVAKGQRLQD